MSQARQRNAALQDYGALTGVPKELSGIVDVAARVCGVPTAAVNLLTSTEQHQVATFGFDGAVSPLHESMCAVVLEDRHTVVVRDARLDPRFADLAPVRDDDPGVRFYASHPLVTPDDLAVGRLCVFDSVPRTLDDNQVAALASLAERVVDLLELARGREELERTLAALRATQEELETANERLSAFAAQVSHDLKAPLSSLSMSLDLMEEELGEGRDPRQLAWFLLKARLGAGRMTTLIDDVLEYATQGGRITRGAVDLDLVLATALDDLQDLVRDATVHRGRLPTVEGDEVKLRSLVQNLLSNAVKFARPGVAPVVVVEARRLPGGWRVEITDNGRGLAAGQDPDALFEPLVRGDRDVPGAGIGLATCRRIVRAHGGSIGLVPAHPRGLTAWFELPD